VDQLKYLATGQPEAHKIPSGQIFPEGNDPLGQRNLASDWEIRKP